MSPNVYDQIALQTGDSIVERKVCAVSGQKFAIFQKDRAFLDTISPTFAGQKFVIPNPTHSPDERQSRRLMQRNERNYYKSSCALTGKAIITSVNPQSGEPVYDGKVRRSDAWDAMEYGQDVESDKSFFTQFHALKKRVPKIAMMNDNGVGSTNCEYTYDFSYGKDCYMCTENINCENCYYSLLTIENSRFLGDCVVLATSEYCVECMDSDKLYHGYYATHCSSSSNMYFARDCNGCSNCLWCVGLRNASYCIANKQVSKEEFLTQRDALLQRLQTERMQVLQEWHDYASFYPMLYANLINADGCYGNNIFDSSESIFAFDSKDIERCRYYFAGSHSKDCMDVTICCPKGRCYEGVTPDFGRKVCFSTFCRWSSDVWYSEMCHRCQHCFGCVGLKDKEYCIFNKQYTKEEYELTVAKIIDQMIAQGEWGEYFPAWTSAYPYNKSDAMQRYPLTKEEALAIGYRRDDEYMPVNIPENATTILGKDLDTNPLTIDDSIVEKVIICQETGMPFRIIKPELELYRKMNFPLPRLHHDRRHQQRMQRRLGRNLYVRTCPVTDQVFITPYSPDYQGRVVSKEAYEKEIYG